MCGADGRMGRVREAKKTSEKNVAYGAETRERRMKEGEEGNRKK